jgi:hypothetical protein
MIDRRALYAGGHTRGLLLLIIGITGRSSAWYRKAVEAAGKVVFTGKVNDDRIINRPEPSFSVARAIKVYNGPILIVCSALFYRRDCTYGHEGIGRR